MKHLFVNYELALLAKEKGFNELCLTYYGISSKTLFPIGARVYQNSVLYSDPENSTVTAPLYQQLVDWFRDKHKLHIGIDTMAFGYVGYHNNTPDPKTWSKDKRYRTNDYKEYYQALIKALTEAFKLI